MDRQVTWVHVLEIQDIIGECVDGGEMILTTGVEFTSKEIALAFLNALIDAGVAALCIETALYYHNIDPELIAAANDHDFPMIEITEISRFKDISKGMNSLILQNKSDDYQRADSYDHTLNDGESIGTIEDGIRYTADYLDLEVAYLPQRGKNFVTSSAMHTMAGSVLKRLEESQAAEELYCRGRIAIKSLIINGKSYGHLVFKSNHGDIGEFERMILGRLSNKVKNDLLKELQQREEKLYEDNKWIHQWMKGELEPRDIRGRLEFVGAVERYSQMFVCSGKLEEPVTFRDFIIHMGLDVRQAFEKENFLVQGYPDEVFVSYLIFDRGDPEDLTCRLQSVFRDLRHGENMAINYRKLTFCAGKKVHDWESIKKSYGTSLTFTQHPELAADGIVFYDDLYVNRLLAQLVNTELLDDFICDHLGPLMEADNMELLQTLNMYYQCNCSKQRTAEKLYIVRQTLYFRLQKLEEMLGKGFDKGERKLALEIALRGYLYGKDFTDCTSDGKD